MEQFEEMDALHNTVLDLLISFVDAAQLVVRFDGTDRLSIEQLRAALQKYDYWLANAA